jgi:NADH-quinone oxidoreductase subunit A
MPQNYVPIFVFLLVAFLVAAGTLVVATIVRPNNPEKVKGQPYECGIEPVDDARQRYTVRFYIIAILFVVFDVETIFLFPWAAQFKALGAFGFLEMLVFLGILVLGYVWVWKKGALEWI